MKPKEFSALRARIRSAPAFVVLLCVVAAPQLIFAQQGKFDSSELSRQNFDRVAASASDIRTLLANDAGLMVALKRWIAKDASDHGQFVSDADLTDDAIFDRLQADVPFRAVATEVWMHQHRRRLSAPVLVGVGAAFDFHAGRVPSAPEWMREHGFEWAFRLGLEPKRLWRRYLVLGAEFAFRMALEILRSRGGPPSVALGSRAHPNPTANPSERTPDA